MGVNRANSRGETPLFCAVLHGSRDAARYLLANDNTDQNPLVPEHKSLIRFVLEANLSSPPEYSWFIEDLARFSFPELENNLFENAQVLSILSQSPADDIQFMLSPYTERISPGGKRAIFVKAVTSGARAVVRKALFTGVITEHIRDSIDFRDLLGVALSRRFCSVANTIIEHFSVKLADLIPTG